jgi:glycosyltransferase involved in cell wall biosynthesis
MKILIISAVFPPEPVVSASISFDLANELAKENEVTVLCPPPTRPLGYHFKQPAEITTSFRRVEMNSYTFPQSKIFGRLRESFSFGKHCADYIKTHVNSIEVIYLNAWPLFSQFLIATAAKKVGLPYIVHVQDIYPESILDPAKKRYRLPYNFFLRTDQYVMRNARAVVTISDQMCNYIENTRKIRRPHVVYNWQGGQSDAAAKAPQNPGSAFLFMFLGSISPTAAVDVLIRGFAEANIQASRLLIAGAGSDKERLVKIASGYPGKQIEFTAAPKDEVYLLQQSADVLLLSLRKGGAKYAIPSKLTSYLFSEKPVLACVEKESAVEDIISQAGCGWVCDITDQQAVTAAFQKARESTDRERAEKAKNGRDFAEKKLSREANLAALKHIILSNQ